MIVETETIKNEVFMNEEGTHRYLLQRTWGKPNAAIVAVITLKPGMADVLHNDLTTMLIQNHVADMGYQGFVALNLVSGISSSNQVSQKSCDQENEDKLLKEILNKKEVQQVIVACGSMITKKGYPQERLKEILGLLTKTNQEKVVTIVNEKNQPIHPLVPNIRNQPWLLKKVKL